MRDYHQCFCRLCNLEKAVPSSYLFWAHYLTFKELFLFCFSLGIWILTGLKVNKKRDLMQKKVTWKERSNAIRQYNRTIIIWFLQDNIRFLKLCSFYLLLEPYNYVFYFFSFLALWWWNIGKKSIQLNKEKKRDCLTSKAATPIYHIKTQQRWHGW